MIDGVTVLSQTEVMEAPYHQVIVIASFVIAFVVFAIFEHALTNDVSCLSLCIALLLAAVIGLGYFKNFKEPTGIYEYKVLIDRSVSFVELTERYNMIEKDGLVYTIRDIEYE